MNLHSHQDGSVAADKATLFAEINAVPILTTPVIMSTDTNSKQKITNTETVAGEL